jgi:drug/metabolite transporter, DME family
MSWGSQHTVSKLLLGTGLTATHLALGRFVFCALVLLAVALATGRLPRLADASRRDLLGIAGIGLCGYFVSITLSLMGLSLLPVSLNSLLSNTAPLFVALLSPLLLREWPSRRAIVGLLAGFAGVGVLVQSGGPAGGVALVGVLFSLTSALAWALYTLLGRRLGASVDPVLFTLIGSLVSTPPLLAVAAAEGELDRLAAAGPFQLLGLAWIGIVATGLAYLVWTSALRRLPAARVAAYGYLVPVFAVLFAVLLLGEHPTPLFFVGAGLVLAGVVAAQR